MESKRAALLMLLAVTIQAAAAAAAVPLAPFTTNYLAETDASHTRVLNAGERVDLVLDKQSGTFVIKLQNNQELKLPEATVFRDKWLTSVD